MENWELGWVVRGGRWGQLPAAQGECPDCRLGLGIIQRTITLGIQLSNKTLYQVYFYVNMYKHVLIEYKNMYNILDLECMFILL